MKTTLVRKPKNQISLVKRILIIIPIVLILLAVSGFVYTIYRYSQVHVDQKYVNSWSDLTEKAPTGTEPTDPNVTPAPATEPTAIDDGPAQLSDVDTNNDPIILIDQKDPNIENILLIGIDGGDGLNIGHRSDSMIIVSINSDTKKVKLISLQRDIKAYYPNSGKYNKLNASYAFGGPGETVNIINYNFDLDIQKYVVVDFQGFRDIVNVIGGVTVDVKDKEVKYIPDLTEAGTYLLDGSQTLAYSRIRHSDDDFVRSQRQRDVLLSIFADLRGEDPLSQTSVANKSLAFMRSNISVTEITGSLFNLALKVDSKVDQYSVPQSGMYSVEELPVWYINMNWTKANKALHEYIWGAEGT